MKKILVLYGSASYEHDVSLLSMNTIKNNIDYNKYDVDFCYIDKNNDWYVDDIKIDNIINYLKSFDVVFPIIHGNYGEDGKLEGLLDLFNIRYVGSKCEASSISFDKDITKIICAKYNIPQVNYVTIYKNQEINYDDIKYPVIIKPARCGSSIGINIAYDEAELDDALSDAFKYDNKVIIEDFLDIRELECSIIYDDGFKTGEVGEVISCNDFYDYEAKYEKDSKICIPADIDVDIKNKIKEYSIQIGNILDIKGYSRVDFLLDKNNNIYFNEINTIPGFTDISMFLKLLVNDSFSIKDIITMLIENA